METATPQAISAGRIHRAPALQGTAPPGASLDTPGLGPFLSPLRTSVLMVIFSVAGLHECFSWGISPHPKFWSHKECCLSPHQRAVGRVPISLPPNPGSILGGEASLLSLPLFFLCSCEMLISVSFSWFTCFLGGLGWVGMRMRVLGGRIQFRTPQF